jgi:N-acetylneuraminic acid mutarotase
MNRAAPRVLGVLTLGALWGLLAASSLPTSAGADARWSSFAELQRPRAFAQAVALPSGEILVVGGLDRGDPQVTNTRSELIDPLSLNVAVLGQALLGRLHQTVTLGKGERVVMAGGVQWLGEQWLPVDRVDVYRTATRSWSLGATLKEARSDHAATTLKDGRVAVIGGNFNTKLLRSVEIYDATSDTWQRAAPLPRPRTQHTAVTLRDGRVLVVGGIDSNGGATDSTFLYDPTSDAWSDGPRMTVPRLQHATVVLPSGDVLLAGGDGLAAGTSEIYLAREQRFEATGLLVHPRLVAQMAALPDGRVVLTGGLPPTMTEYRPMSSTEIWDPVARAWRLLTPTAAGRAWGTLIRVGGALYLVSGTGSDETAFRSVERLPIN